MLTQFEQSVRFGFELGETSDDDKETVPTTGIDRFDQNNYYTRNVNSPFTIEKNNTTRLVTTDELFKDPKRLKDISEQLYEYEEAIGNLKPNTEIEIKQYKDLPLGLRGADYDASLPDSRAGNYDKNLEGGIVVLYTRSEMIPTEDGENTTIEKFVTPRYFSSLNTFIDAMNVKKAASKNKMKF